MNYYDPKRISKWDYLWTAFLVVGIILILATSNLIPSSILALPVTAITPVAGGSLGASMSSSNPNPPALLSLLGQTNLTSGAVYQWTLTVKNTGTVSWTASHVTVRIAGSSIPNAPVVVTPYEILSSATSIGNVFQQDFGANTFGQGVVQVCYDSSLQSNQPNWSSCLVNLAGASATTAISELWHIGSPNVIAFSPDFTIGVVQGPSNLAPGQSATFSFRASIPALNSSQFGQYYALENLVAFSSSVNGADLVDYNIVPINLTSGVSGVLTNTGIEAIAGVGLSIAGILGIVGTYLKRRK